MFAAIDHPLAPLPRRRAGRWLPYTASFFLHLLALLTLTHQFPWLNLLMAEETALAAQPEGIAVIMVPPRPAGASAAGAPSPEGSRQSNPVLETPQSVRPADVESIQLKFADDPRHHLVKALRNYQGYALCVDPVTREMRSALRTSDWSRSRPEQLEGFVRIILTTPETWPEFASLPKPDGCLLMAAFPKFAFHAALGRRIPEAATRMGLQGEFVSATIAFTAEDPDSFIVTAVESNLPPTASSAAR